MPNHRAIAGIARARSRWGAIVRVVVPLLALTFAGADAATSDAPTLVIERALTATTSDGRFPGAAALSPIALPDDWADSRPGYDGLVWYRAASASPRRRCPTSCSRLYVERACTNLQVLLNGHLIYSGGRMAEPITRNCRRPQLITLPPALLQSARQRPRPARLRPSARKRGSIRRAGGLSAIELGLQSTLAKDHVTQPALGAGVDRGHQPGPGRPRLPVLLAIGWLHKREVYFSYFGWLCLGWVVLSHGDLDPRPALGQRRHRIHAELGWPVLLALRGAVLPQLRRPALADDREHRRLAVGALPLSLLVAGHD